MLNKIYFPNRTKEEIKHSQNFNSRYFRKEEDRIRKEREQKYYSKYQTQSNSFEF